MPASFSDLIRLPVAIPSQIGRDLSVVADAVSRLPALIIGLDARIARLGEDVATIGATATALQLHVATLGTDLTAVGKTVSRADARVAKLETLVGELAARVSHIDDGLDERIPDLQGVPTDVHRIARDVARVLELTPDPDEPGALGKVRDALTPGA